MDKLTYTRKECSEKTGMSLPMLDAFLHRSESPMPHICVGRKILIPVNALEVWLLEEVKRVSSSNGLAP